MKQVKKTSVRIKTIRQAASSIPGAPGNLLINVSGDAKPENWFSSREWRNFLIGSGFNPLIPCVLFVGSTIKFEQLEVTKEDLIQPSVLNPGTLVYIHKLNGRDVEYKQPGLHNVNLELDLQSMTEEKIMAFAELSIKYPRARVNQLITAGSGTTTTETVEETIQDETTAPARTVEDLVTDKVAPATANTQEDLVQS